MIRRLSKHITSRKAFDPGPKDYEVVANNMMNVAYRYADKHGLFEVEVAANCVCMIIANIITHLDETNMRSFIRYFDDYVIKEGLENRNNP